MVSRILMGGSSSQRAIRSVTLASFMSSAGFSAIFPLLPLYARELEGPEGAAFWSGLAMAATPMAGAIASPFWGKLADRFGYRPMLIRALICTTAIMAAMALPNAAWQLVVLRALAGALGSFQAAAMAAISNWSKPEELSRAVSRLQIAQIAGAILAPAAGGGIAALLGIRYVAVMSAVILAIGLLMVIVWLDEPERPRSRERSVEGGFQLTLLWLPIVTLLAVQFTDASFYTVLPLLLVSTGEAGGTLAGLSGLAASLSSIAGALASALAGQTLRHGLRARTVAVATLVLAVLTMMAIVAPMPWGMIGVRVLCGGAVAAIAVAAYSAGGLAAPRGHRGVAYGWLTSSSMGGFAASPVVAGMMATIDLRAVLVLDAGLCLCAALGWGLSRANPRKG